ncbi:MAG: hypothetical protein AB7N80_12685 [Bdellovibrionales bacterium]
MKLVVQIITVLFCPFFAQADDLGSFKWVCSVSRVNESGVTAELLNVVFIKPDQTRQILYQSATHRISFERDQNKLDHENELSIILRAAPSLDELFRAYGQEDQEFGFKWQPQKIAAYCRSR